jgi:methionyl-tRNA formyltransferase
MEKIGSYECDYYIVVAYGKILPKSVLESPKKMCINIHGSLLPAYRGASPIQAALLG